MSYRIPDKSVWTGRESAVSAYMHEVINCKSLQEIENSDEQKIALLGYACDEGVRRNLGRTGAKNGPGAIRNRLAKVSNHPGLFSQIVDFGDICCAGDDLEGTQEELAHAVTRLLDASYFPKLMGGGHDIAYGHYQGIRKHLNEQKIGIINFDAHFDLRTFQGESTSGTPFYQIATDCASADRAFHYMCLGVQPLSNIPELYQTADQLGASYVNRKEFSLSNLEAILDKVDKFVTAVDHIYFTIDLDGFAASIAPGVSAPSPFGFDVDLVLILLDKLFDTGKVISMDIAELNPEYDIDRHTARLAAYLIAYIIQR
ncbi:MAG: formimidoylglutamase [Bacteroidota bacterium]